MYSLNLVDNLKKIKIQEAPTGDFHFGRPGFEILTNHPKGKFLANSAQNSLMSGEQFIRSSYFGIEQPQNSRRSVQAFHHATLLSIETKPNLSLVLHGQCKRC